MRVLGIIPARGGSKGISRKNLVQVAGLPLIAWSIRSAAESRKLWRWIVSTDDDEIADVAAEYGATVCRRPDALCRDNSGTLEVVQWHLSSFPLADAAMVLQPTCPMRTPEVIDAAIAKMIETDCDSVVSYAPVGAWHPVRMARLHPISSEVSPIDVDAADRGQLLRRRQELEPLYIRSGDIYLTKADVVRQGSLLGKDCRAVIVPHERHVNIDDRYDLAVAEVMLREDRS